MAGCNDDDASVMMLVMMLVMMIMIGKDGRRPTMHPNVIARNLISDHATHQCNNDL